MAGECSERDPREAYAWLLRAVAGRVELEQSFGIESWPLPLLAVARPAPRAPAAAPPPLPRAAPAHPPAPSPPHLPPPNARSEPVPKPTAGPAGRPGPAPGAVPPTESAPMPDSPARVVTTSGPDLFGAKRCDIQIPEGLSKREQLDFLQQAMQPCALCSLRKGARQIVFGVGSPDAELMFVGEAPGHDEDVQGIPFVGRAGQLLTRIIEAMGMTREEVYIANICKCRPPENRAPTPEEMETCRPYLLRQIEIIQPKILCLLGATAIRGLLQSKESISRVRGQFLQWHGLLVVPTFHPAYLLRNPAEKRTVWEDVQKIRDALRNPKKA